MSRLNIKHNSIFKHRNEEVARFSKVHLNLEALIVAALTATEDIDLASRVQDEHVIAGDLGALWSNFGRSQLLAFIPLAVEQPGSVLCRQNTTETSGSTALQDPAKQCTRTCMYNDLSPLVNACELSAYCIELK